MYQKIISFMYFTDYAQSFVHYKVPWPLWQDWARVGDWATQPPGTKGYAVCQVCFAQKTVKFEKGSSKLLKHSERNVTLTLQHPGPSRRRKHCQVSSRRRWMTKYSNRLAILKCEKCQRKDFNDHCHSKLFEITDLLHARCTLAQSLEVEEWEKIFQQ